MNFKKIEVFGFKSFADRKKVEFQEGITGIVGPNGCGKSNVADAVRWVLGEQSAKALRGKSMQDVIFNGTARRKPMSYSEVSTIRASCLPISITRKSRLRVSSSARARASIISTTFSAD